MKAPTGPRGAALFRVLAGATLVLAAVSATALLLSLAEHPLVRETHTLEVGRITRELGFCFVTPNPAGYSDRSAAVVTHLLEDGRPLPGPDALHADIRAMGKGRYSFWDTTLYFSTSDNTNPKRNGRTYVVLSPAAWLWTLYALTAICAAIVTLIVLVAPSQRALRARIASPRFQLGASLLLLSVVFVSTRLTYFTDIKRPLLTLDSQSYLIPAQDLLELYRPMYDVRTPGYPLFISLFRVLWPNLDAVVVAQCALTFVSAAFLSWAFFRTLPRLTFLCSIPVAIHLGVPLMLIQDFSIMTESLFASCMILHVGALLVGIVERRSSALLLSSLAGGFAVITRPNGVVLLAFLLATVLFMALRGDGRRRIMAYGLPMVALLATVIGYNFFACGFLGFSRIGGMVMFGITAPAWQTDTAYPESANRAIRQFQAEIPPADAAALDTSWDAAGLYRPFIEQAGRAIHLYKPMVKTSAALKRSVYMKALRSRPDMYAKWCWVMVHSYLFGPAPWTTGLDQELSLSSRVLAGTANQPPKQIPTDPGAMRPSLSRNLNRYVGAKLAWIFGGRFWTYAYLAIVVMAAGVLVWSRFRHLGAFLLSSICGIHLVSGVFLAMFAGNVNRYPAPTMYLAFLAIPLAFTLVSPGWIEQEPASADQGSGL